MTDLRITACAYAHSIHDYDRDDIDFPVLYSFGWTKKDGEMAEETLRRARERVAEYEAALEEDGHFGASEFISEIALEVRAGNLKHQPH